MVAQILALPLACSVCGQHCKKTSPFGTGYALDDAGARICYACCNVRDRAYMVEHGKHSGLYLVANPNYRAPSVGMCGTGGAPYYVTNWPGTLRLPVYGVRYSFHNLAGRNGRRDFWFHGPDGFVWHGVNIGDNDLARCRRTKEKAKITAGRRA